MTLEGNDRGVKHLVDAFHALVEIFTLDALGAHTVVGVEELDRGGQIIIEELLDLRDICGIGDGVLHDLVRDTHDLVDLLLDLGVGDGHIKPAHLAQRTVALLDDRVDLRPIALFRGGFGLGWLGCGVGLGHGRTLAGARRCPGLRLFRIVLRSGSFRFAGRFIFPDGLADNESNGGAETQRQQKSPQLVKREELR